MTGLEDLIGKLAEGTARGVSRREFLKLLLATGGAAILVSLGLDRVYTSGLEPEAVYCPGITCSIPCDSRPACIQTAVHYSCSDCSGPPRGCPIETCEADKMCKHTCRRCCYPSNCMCGEWQVYYSCVDCPGDGSCPPARCSCRTVSQCAASLEESR
ncbi:MAG: twin-arginine translocation signal domain-containing protein [Chloroflexota bacterium]